MARFYQSNYFQMEHLGVDGRVQVFHRDIGQEIVNTAGFKVY